MIRLQFEGILAPWLGGVLAILGAAAIWIWYRRETHALAKPWPIVLPMLRAIAVALMLAMLTGPILSRQWLSGDLANILVLIDESSSMQLEDVNKSMHRSARVAQWLAGDGDRAGWLAKQRSAYHLQVFGFGSLASQDNELRSIWDSAVDSAVKPVQLDVRDDGKRSAIGESLDAVATGSFSPAAIVLLSDGQSNAGVGMESAADRLRDRKIPVYAVGMGRLDEPNDVAVLTVEHPKSIVASDAFQGTATLKQQLPERTPYRFMIRKDGKPLWTESLVADGSTTRTIDYRFDGELLFEDSDDEPPAGNRLRPIDLEFEIAIDGQDAMASNNSLESSLWGVTQKNRVLVMDERGRWETRYIKNAFQRDSVWEVDAILGETEFEERKFPASREELLPFDVLIVSLDSTRAWNEAQHRWIADHIAESGAGFIAIDSGRERSPDEMQPNIDWLPVVFDTKTASAAVQRLELMPTAWAERAFAFEADEQANSKLWSSFPVPRVARRVEEKPGAEILVVGRSESDVSLPMIVTRRFGQGKVVYMANDESWRWRYNVADLYHQRFWSQMAQWAMQAPFAMENEFAAFDIGDRTCRAGAVIPIRALLKNADRSPLAGARAYAILQKDGVRIDSIPLTEYPSGSGMYAGSSPAMPEGKYTFSLEVPGVPKENIPWHSDVHVHANADVEMQSLARNGSGLEQLANRTGGVYVDESEIDTLTDLLKPRQSGKLEESRWPLWQSYPWFIAIVALLSLEWFFRKRAGLV
ncbi:MAG: VWA domain-containing protein [Planctomycetota bacterium]